MLTNLVLFCVSIEIDLINTEARIFGDGIITPSLVQSKDYLAYTSVVIEEGPTEILSGSFSGCSNLVNITLPLSLSKISFPFFRCYSLTNFFISKNHQHFICPMNKAIYSINKSILYVVAPNYQNFNFETNVEIIHTYAFSCYKGTHPITIPKTVYKICDGAFCETYLFQVIYFEEGSIIKHIDGRSMWYTSAKEKHIPPSVVSIGAEAMLSSGATKIIFDRIEDSNCTSIGSFCFVSFKGESITLPPKLVSLSDSLFENSPNLKTVNIPKSCTKISQIPFAKCPKLESITVDEGNMQFKDINGVIYDYTESFLVFLPPGANSFNISSKLQQLSSGIIQTNTMLYDIWVDENSEYFSANDGVLYDKDKSVVKGICGCRKSAVFVSTVKSIDSQACALSGLEEFSFEIDDNCTKLQGGAFQGCVNLTTARIPKTVTEIYSDCFRDCKNLKIVYADFEFSMLNTIPYACFHNTAITNFTVAPKVTSLENNAFYGCTKLISIDFSLCECLVTIGVSALRNCYSLLNVILPSTVETIQSSAFLNLAATVFDLSKCVIIKSIGTFAFSSSNISSINFGSSLEIISSNAFDDCPNLESVTFNSDCPLDKIAPAVFQGCSKLSKVKLPKNVQTVEPSAFKGCNSLQSITAHSDSEYLETSEGVLYTIGCECLLVNPPGRSSVTTAIEVEKIGSNAFYMCSLLNEIKMDKSKKLIEIAESTFTGCIGLTEIFIPSSIRTIGASSFSDCGKLSSVKFDDNSLLQCIEKSLFENCVQLSTITFGLNSAITEIKEKAFANCGILTTFEIPSNCSKIGNKVFEGSGIIKLSFKLDSKLTKITKGSFENADKLEEFSFPPSCANFETGSFSGCLDLRKVNFSSSITNIPDNAFQGLSRLSTLNNFENIQSIGCLSFSKTSLEEVKLGKNIISIGSSAFSSTPLHTVFYCGDPLEISFNDIFPQNTLIYVKRNYPNEHFCGKPVQKAIDSETCQFIGTPVISQQFTVPSGFRAVHVLLIADAVMQSSEGV